MISMVVNSKFYPTPITEPFLALILDVYVLRGMTSLCAEFASASFEIVLSNFFWVFALIAPMSLSDLFGVGSLPAQSLLISLLEIGPAVFIDFSSDFFGVLLVIQALAFAYFFGVFDLVFTHTLANVLLFLLVIGTSGGSFTLFALRLQSAFDFSIAMKVFSRCRELLTALGAALSRRGIHSVSLSLHLELVSAGGEIDRRFGLQSLADKGNYTPILAGVTA